MIVLAPIITNITNCSIGSETEKAIINSGFEMYIMKSGYMRSKINTNTPNNIFNPIAEDNAIIFVVFSKHYSLLRD